MRFLYPVAVFAVVLLAPTALLAQLPPGYWSYYDSGKKNYHRAKAHHEHSRQQAPRSTGEPHQSVYEPWAAPGPPADPMDYAGRGMTGGGLSAYQSNGYTGPNQNLYYGYWDGGFNPGLYGFSMYSHFDRPGFTYWQY